MQTAEPVVCGLVSSTKGGRHCQAARPRSCDHSVGIRRVKPTLFCQQESVACRHFNHCPMEFVLWFEKTKARKDTTREDK